MVAAESRAPARAPLFPVIPADSRLKLGWDIVVVLAVFLSGIILPYRLVSGYDPTDLVYWLLTAVFSLDIAVNFNTEVREGLVVSADRQDIARRYLRGWFAVDLLSALPLAPLLQACLAHGDGGQVVQGLMFFRLLRLLRLVKLAKISGTFRALQDRLSVPPALMRLVIFFFWFALIAHGIALGWIAIGAAEPGRSFGDQYLRALYWCVTTITTIGYGDYYPNHDSNLQIVYTIGVQLLGVGVFGYIIGNVATLIVNIDTARADYQQKVAEIKGFMIAKQIPPGIQERVRNYFTYLWETRRSVSGTNLLLELPPTLRMQISLHLNRDILEKVSLLKGCDEVLLHEVVEALEPLVFLPGDTIIRQGELGECMYFLTAGSVEVLVGDTVVAALHAGSPFGEAALVKQERRNAAVRATTYCDVYRLSQQRFDALRTRYPEFDARVRRVVAEREAAARG